MMRSMFAGVSGLRNHQIKMDVIGNNIANVNTYGYKMSRVAFQDMYSQNIRSASSGTAGLGGTNPMQIGLGTSTAAIDVLHEGGGAATTDRPLDFCIEGNGFFAVQQNEDTYYTRAGNLYLDAQGYLITANGLFVKGIMGTDEGNYFDLGVPDKVNLIDLENFDPENDGDDVGRLVIPDGFESISINSKGVISGKYKDGETYVIGQILLTTFKNPSGLTKEGNNLYAATANSGPAVIGQPGATGVGTIRSGALEMSNVDLSKEFTDMIITQRGFQANSRIITVSDTLLEELINLKR